MIIGHHTLKVSRGFAIIPHCNSRLTHDRAGFKGVKPKVVNPTEHTILEDAKLCLKKKLVEALYPGVKINIVKDPRV